VYQQQQQQFNVWFEELPSCFIAMLADDVKSLLSLRIIFLTFSQQHHQSKNEIKKGSFLKSHQKFLQSKQVRSFLLSWSDLHLKS
jgi:hypothetical protein